MNLKKLILAGLFILFAVSCGDSSGPSEDLSVTVTAPPASGASAVDSYTVTWTSSASGTVSLYYNSAATPLGQTLIASGLSASGSHSWDLASVADGSYFVRAVITSGASSGSDWSDGALSVDHSSGEPGITVTDPPLEGASADTSYAIKWVSSGYTGGTLSIYLDTDTDPSEGLVEIGKGLEDTGEYLWNCASFTEGYYYVYATISDGTNENSVYSSGMLTVDHGGLTPDFYITKPPAAGAEADLIYTIQWESTAPLNSTVDLYYDTDEDPSSGLVEIAMDVSDDGYYTWNCSSAPEGTYYIYGILETSTPVSIPNYAALTALSAESRGTTVTDYSNGTLTITHNAQYNINITNPPASGAAADSSYQINWTTDAPSSEQVTLFYAPDTVGSELLDLAILSPPVGTSYNWDCSFVEEGSYFIHAVLGTRGMGSDWSSGTVNITHADEYTFTMTTPPASGATADDEYLLLWDTDAPAGAYVSLHYGQPGGSTDQIVSGISNSGEYTWGCAGVPEGDYYVYGVVSDSRNPRPLEKGTGSDWSDGALTIEHPGSGYSMTVTSPANPGEPADSTFTIEWEATGGAGAVVNLYYDLDTDPTTMTLIRENVANTGSLDWNCYAVPEDEYYIFAIIWDPADGRPNPGTDDDSAQDYSEGTVNVSHEYNYITVTSPPPGGGQADASYPLYWAAASQAGPGTVDLYYDTDTDPSSGLVAITSNLAWDLFNYLWNCSAVPDGSYYIYAELENPGGTYSDYSDGMLLIDHDPLYFDITAPPPPGATADDQYDLKWQSTGPDGRLMDLYYDTDINPSSGLVLIAEDIVCTEYLSTYKWSCSAVPEGSYYIYGLLEDPAADGQYTAYSEGMLTISH